MSPLHASHLSSATQRTLDSVHWLRCKRRNACSLIGDACASTTLCTKYSGLTLTPYPGLALRHVASSRQSSLSGAPYSTGRNVGSTMVPSVTPRA